MFVSIKDRQLSDGDFYKFEGQKFLRDKHTTDEGEDKWYKRLFKRIVNWFKKRRLRNRSTELRNFIMKYSTKPDSEENPASLSEGHDRSKDDIPRQDLNVKIEDQLKPGAELSPLQEEPWKEDYKLMLDGTYSRFNLATGFLDKYRFISMIGQGSFGFVMKAERSRDYREVAIKFIYRPNINASHWAFDSELGMVPSEVYFLKNLRHPGIVQCLDYFDDGRYVYLITELFGTSWSPISNPKLSLKKNPGLKFSPTNINVASKINSSFDRPENRAPSAVPFDLFECIEAHKSLPEGTIHFIFKQLLEVVVYLTSQGVVHRDLKDENVVVDADYRIKIVDFGCAARIPWIGHGNEREEGWFEKFNGTLAFAPPEVIRGQKYRGSEAEIWTLGVLLYTMAFRQAPFQDAQSILYGQLEFPFEEDKPGILDLLRKLLCKNPRNRIKLTELRVHPWVIKRFP